MIKTVVFDLDGTLANTLADLAHAMNYALEKHGLSTYPVDDYRHFVGNGIDNLVRVTMADGYTPDGAAVVKADFNAYYADHCRDYTEAYDGIAELLKRLENDGIATAVISNKNQADVEQVLSHCFPDFAFDAAVGLLEGEALKPDPAPAKRMLRILHADPTDLFAVIGDSAVDVRFAKALNVPSIGCAWGFRGQAELQDAGADRIAQDADALLTVLSQM